MRGKFEPFRAKGVARWSPERGVLLHCDVGGMFVSIHDYNKLAERTEELEAALKLAQPILNDELQYMCESYCPPCEVGELYDYSELKDPELGWITRTEAALDAVDKALEGRA
jgi:hypothetical protein